MFKVVDCIRGKIALIPLKLSLSTLTLTLTNHVPITIHKDMMWIIVSHCIQSCNKASHKLLMLIKIEVL
jgi:hypothetical protein